MLLLSGALVVGLAQPVVLSPAAAVEVEQVRPREGLPPVLASVPQDVRPDPSSVVRTSPDAASAGTADPAPAPPVAPEVAGFDPATSQVVSRAEFSTTFENVDGTRTTELSEVPLNVPVSGVPGGWAQASNQVSAAPGGEARAARHPLLPQFAATAADAELLTVRDPREGFSQPEVSARFALQGAAASPLVRSAEGARYADVLPGQDLVYTVTEGGVKQELVLDAAPTAGAAGAPVGQWRWTVRTAGLTPRASELGGIEFVDATGEVRLGVPRGLAWDSSGRAGVAEPAETPVEVSISPAGAGAWTLTQSVDPAWLGDPARVYPVTVDPSTVGVGANRTIAYKSDGYACEGCGTRIGNSRSSNVNTYSRSLVKYDYEQFFGRQVVEAKLHYVTESGTANLYPAQVHHATAFSYNGVGDYLSPMPTGGDGLATDWGLTARIGDWVRTGIVGGYLMVAGYEAPGGYTYKSGRTALYVTTNQFANPGVPSNGAPGNGWTQQSTQPLLSTNASDPEGDGIYFAYHVGTSPTNDAATRVWDSGWTSQRTVQVPPNRLNGATRYYWWSHVQEPGWQGYNGFDTVRWSGPFEFTTQRPAPTPPQGSAVPGDGQVVTTLTPTLSTGPTTDLDVDPDADPVQYRFSIGTGADGVTGAVLTSDWLSVPAGAPAGTGVSWTPPAGSLRDGGAYTWSVQVKDSVQTTYPAWRNKLRINQRVGESGPAPVDQAGPVTVNLANGNAGLRLSSPTVNAVGGPMGLSLSYNSLQPVARGLTREYFAATSITEPTGRYDFAGRTPLLVRTDP